MAYCGLLHQNNFSLLEILGWLTDVNLALYSYQYTSSLNIIVKIIAIITFGNKIFKYFRRFQKMDLCETYIHNKQFYVRSISMKFEQFSPS